MRYKYLILILLNLLVATSHAQDMHLFLNKTLLPGKNILKVKRDFKDPYLWVLAQNNEVYRINSLDFTVADYTAQFSAYAAYNFIDIAGRSQDTVFIATNTTNVIQFKKGFTGIIGSAQGVAGKVNSIGISSIYESTPSDIFGYLPSPFILYIATDNGLCQYDYKTERMYRPIESKPSRIYDASYRSHVIEEFGSCRCYPSNVVQAHGLSSIFNATVATGNIYTMDIYGNTIKSAYGLSGSPFEPNRTVSYLGRQLWATENGLFDNHWNSSSLPETSQLRQYLQGLDINKISSIYSMLKFGANYNEVMVKENVLIGTSQGLYFSDSQYQYNAPFNFKYFAGLGNKVINDICVNTSSIDIINMMNTCENGVWVAAVDGLYWLDKTYGPYVTAPSYINLIAFEGSNMSKNELQLCDATSIKASVNTFIFNGSNIQWHKNGMPLSGETNQDLTITEAGDYFALLYDPCGATTVESNHLKVTMLAAPVVALNYPDELNYCSGTTATLSTTSDPNYQYRWYRDGILTNNTTATLNTNQNGKYKVEASACSGSWVTSKEVKINFINITKPQIIADKPAYCIGASAALSTAFINDGKYTIDWQRDGSPLPAEQNKTSISTTIAGNYTVTISSNLVACTQTSVAYPVSFAPAPTIILQRIVNTTLCDGQTIDLKATYAGGTIKWSTGQTTDNISIKQSGTYVATVKAPAGCEIIATTTIQFLPNPIINLPDAQLCQFTNEAITLTAPGGFAKYEWNGQMGTSTFVATQTGKLTLTVTDNNGCQASQTITISSHCDAIHVHNAFTPNDDGVNDIWLIAGLQDDPSITVKVFNRYGATVFESIGYATPWDGTFKGSKLATGVYYYIISARQSQQKLSGSVSIIR